jgi:hypothetical protein
MFSARRFLSILQLKQPMPTGSLDSAEPEFAHAILNLPRVLPTRNSFFPLTFSRFLSLHTRRLDNERKTREFSGR